MPMLFSASDVLFDLPFARRVVNPSPRRITFGDFVQFPKSPSKKKRQRKNTFAYSSNLSTIIDIPHLTDTICDHLDFKDVWNCARVNKSWRDAFQSRRYRSVKFSGLSPCQSWDILENVQFIRKLVIDPLDGNYFFKKPWAFHSSHQDPPSVRCTNLRTLSCIDMKYPCFCRDSSVCTACMKQEPVNSINLISTNPRLEQVDLLFAWTSWPWRRRTQLLHLSSNILKSISGLKFLQSLKIGSVLEELDMRQLLIHLPESLELFHIHSRSTIQDNNGHVTVATRRIKSLLIRDPCLWYVPSLLKQSPLLEDIGIQGYLDSISGWSEVMIANCPKIRTIDLSCYRFEVGADAVLAKLLSVYEGLRGFSLTGFGFSPRTFISPLLVSRNVNTLCILHLQINSFFEARNIMETCPNLREVYFDTSGSLGDLIGECTTLSRRPLEYQYTPWACRNLEIFRCRIHTLYFPIDQSMSVMATHIRQIHTLHFELRSLERLQSLRLKWEFNRLRFLLREDHFLSGDGQPSRFSMTKDDLDWMNLILVQDNIVVGNPCQWEKKYQLEDLWERYEAQISKWESRSNMHWR